MIFLLSPKRYRSAVVKFLITRKGNIVTAELTSVIIYMSNKTFIQKPMEQYQVVGSLKQFSKN